MKKELPVPFCRLVERLLAPLKKLDPRLESWTPARVSGFGPVIARRLLRRGLGDCVRVPQDPGQTGPNGDHHIARADAVHHGELVAAAQLTEIGWALHANGFHGAGIAQPSNLLQFMSAGGLARRAEALLQLNFLLDVTLDLFEAAETAPPAGSERLAPGAVLLRAFAAPQATQLLQDLHEVTARSPFRCMTTRGGHRMSVAMSNCGTIGWVSDSAGYRYDAIDRLTAGSWPAMPASFRELAAAAAETAGFPGFVPDACLISRYEPGARLSLHQDKDESDLDSPIVSISMGLHAVFLFGGHHRAERPRRLPLAHADVVVWGGPSRLRFHGVLPLGDGEHPLLGRCRVNLSLRKAR